MYLSFGGFSATSGISRFTRIDDAHLLRSIADPTVEAFNEADWVIVESYRETTAQRLVSAPNLSPADVRHRGFYRSAFAPALATNRPTRAYRCRIVTGEHMERRAAVVEGRDDSFRDCWNREYVATGLGDHRCSLARAIELERCTLALAFAAHHMERKLSGLPSRYANGPFASPGTGTRSDSCTEPQSPSLFPRRSGPTRRPPLRQPGLLSKFRPPLSQCR